MIVDLLVPERTGEMEFVGGRDRSGAQRIYGGQVFSQALMAAAQTTDPERLVHSAHAYFLRSGDGNLPLDLQVMADFDGGSFSNRRVVAKQNGKIILNLAASFHRQDNGQSQDDAMPVVSLPEELEPLPAYLARHADRMIPDPEHIVRRSQAFDIRIVNGPLTFGENKGGDAVHFWFRLKQPVPALQYLHRGVLAYFSDFTLLAASLQRLDVNWSTRTVNMATVDHSLWIHRDVDVNAWLLYVSESPWTANGRGYCRGQFFTQDGHLAGSTTQEGVVRLIAR
ncbi:acyl-CoA thioesterase [Sphingobium sp.]|uniref:acyl-CoA thioesterase n=1 Tax=Sphingobium sp. TaxID=1912891 RepID=UPI0028BEF348|nr:acyl-CoA thioesterase domain-containing protein [Sphingobium sp.]